MPSYIEDKKIDTSSIAYSKTGIKLLEFVNTVYGCDVLAKLIRGDLTLFFNGKEVKFDKNFRNRRVKEDTTIMLRRELKYNEIDMDIFA